MLRIPAIRGGSAKPVPWQPEEVEALRLTYGKLPTEELARLLQRSAPAVKGKALKLGLGSYQYWKPEEDRILRKRFPHEPSAAIAQDLGRPVESVHNRAHRLGLKKSSAYMRGAYREEKRQRALTNPECIAGRFKKGLVPANKGLRRPGWAPGRMAETQFKKGQRSRTAELMHKPIGTERVTRDGILERKINDDLPLQARWRAVHLLVWEAANGPLPPGHLVRFRDGMRTTVAELITLDRLELVTRAENMRRNSYHNNYPKEVGLAIQAKAQLTRAINRATRGERHVR